MHVYPQKKNLERVCKVGSVPFFQRPLALPYGPDTERRETTAVCPGDIVNSCEHTEFNLVVQANIGAREKEKEKCRIKVC